MKRVRYATLMRPPQPGAIPRQGILEVCARTGIAPSGHHAWGWVEYDRELTEEEVKHYDLEYISSAEVVE